jgi:hypothetical protein
LTTGENVEEQENNQEIYNEDEEEDGEFQLPE